MREVVEGYTALKLDVVVDVRSSELRQTFCEVADLSDAAQAALAWRTTVRTGIPDLYQTLIQPTVPRILTIGVILIMEIHNDFDKALFVRTRRLALLIYSLPP